MTEPKPELTITVYHEKARGLAEIATLFEFARCEWSGEYIRNIDGGYALFDADDDIVAKLEIHS